MNYNITLDEQTFFHLLSIVRDSNIKLIDEYIKGTIPYSALTQSSDLLQKISRQEKRGG